MSDERSFYDILSEEIDGWLSPSDLRTLRKKEATGGELKDFSYAIKEAKARNLHPYRSEVFFQTNYDKNAGDDGRYVLTMGVKIDGLRAIANETGEYRGQKGPFWCGPDGEWKDVWLKDEPPKAAKVGILRESFDEPLWHVARWDDYAQTKRNSDKPVYMWADMGPHMLAKCAESGALRRAFPNRIGELYTPEELDKAKGPSRQTDTDEPTTEDKATEALLGTKDPESNGVEETGDPSTSSEPGQVPNAGPPDDVRPGGDGRSVENREATERGPDEEEREGEAESSGGETTVDDPLPDFDEEPDEEERAILKEAYAKVAARLESADDIETMNQHATGFLANVDRKPIERLLTVDKAIRDHSPIEPLPTTFPNYDRLVLNAGLHTLQSVDENARTGALEEITGIGQKRAQDIREALAEKDYTPLPSVEGALHWTDAVKEAADNVDVATEDANDPEFEDEKGLPF